MIKSLWVKLLVALTILNIIAEYFINVNKLANPDSLPLALVIFDELYIIWGPMLFALLIGLIIAIFPIKELSYFSRFKQSFVICFLITTFFVSTFYGFIIYVNGFKEFELKKIKSENFSHYNLTKIRH
jgi:hypothetical protein